MQISKTHIFLRANKYTGMGGKPIECITVHECRLPSSSLAAIPKSTYFKEISGFKGTELELITKEEFEKLDKQTSEILNEL